MGELALLLSTLRLATPLGLAALGELVSERSGVLNIGIEGMMLVGACAAYFVALESGSPLLGLVAGAVAGVSAAAVFAAFVLLRQADPIVCGTALNLLALGITGSVYRARVAVLDSAVGAAPALGDWLGVPAFLWLLAGLALVCAGLLYRTRLGLSIRAVGEAAEAAHAQGISVLGLRALCCLFGGACAGLAGAALVLWISDRFVEGLTSGRGFIALALVLFGGYRIRFILAGAGLFGIASALQFRLQAAGVSIPYNLLLMLPYVLTLALLALRSSRARSPADLARPFHP